MSLNPVTLKKDFYPNSKLWRGYFVAEISSLYIFQHVTDGWVVQRGGVLLPSHFKTLKAAKTYIERNRNAFE